MPQNYLKTPALVNHMSLLKDTTSTFTLPIFRAVKVVNSQQEGQMFHSLQSMQDKRRQNNTNTYHKHLLREITESLWMCTSPTPAKYFDGVLKCQQLRILLSSTSVFRNETGKMYSIHNLFSKWLFPISPISLSLVLTFYTYKWIGVLQKRFLMFELYFPHMGI
jgi:hypothetical protein